MTPPGQTQPATPDRTRGLIDEAIERTRPGLLFHGHWHHRHSASAALGDGHRVRVEGLDMDGSSDGDSLVFDLDDFSVTPLPSRTS